jgi:hypothetical protein
MGGRADFAKRARDRRRCLNGLCKSQLRHGLSSATLKCALDSTDPLILRTALTNPITAAHVELAIDKSSASDGQRCLRLLRNSRDVGLKERAASQRVGCPLSASRLLRNGSMRLIPSRVDAPGAGGGLSKRTRRAIHNLPVIHKHFRRNARQCAHLKCADRDNSFAKGYRHE